MHVVGRRVLEPDLAEIDFQLLGESMGIAV